MLWYDLYSLPYVWVMGVFWDYKGVPICVVVMMPTFGLYWCKTEMTTSKREFHDHYSVSVYWSVASLLKPIDVALKVLVGHNKDHMEILDIWRRAL